MTVCPWQKNAYSVCPEFMMWLFLCVRGDCLSTEGNAASADEEHFTEI